MAPKASGALNKGHAKRKRFRSIYGHISAMAFEAACFHILFGKHRVVPMVHAVPIIFFFPFMGLL
jgi:hypothetical protein